ncbi:MAG: hypothetical protein ACM3RX_02660 [Methanococcaceae archaeon]
MMIYLADNGNCYLLLLKLWVGNLYDPDLGNIYGPGVRNLYDPALGNLYGLFTFLVGNCFDT